MSKSFNLNDFRKKVNQDYGPFVIEWGDEDNLQTVEIAPLLTATAKQQVVFNRSFVELSLVVSGEIARIADDKEALERLVGWTPDDKRTDEELAVDIVNGARDTAKTMLRNLALDKKAFDAFAKEFKGELLEWFLVLGEYCSKYNLFAVNGDGTEGK